MFGVIVPSCIATTRALGRGHVRRVVLRRCARQRTSSPVVARCISATGWGENLDIDLGHAQNLGWGGVFCGGGLKFCLLKRLRGFGIKKRGRNSLTVARSVRVASQSQSMGVASPIFQSGSQCTHYALPVREHGVFALGLVHEHNGDPYQHVFRVQPATQRPVTCTATQRTTPPV